MAPRGALDRQALAALRARSPPCLWLHAASAGELEQARPILDGLRARYPDAALMLTVASPSARRAVESVAAADVVGPCPPTRRGPCAACWTRCGRRRRRREVGPLAQPRARGRARGLPGPAPGRRAEPGLGARALAGTSARRAAARLASPASAPPANATRSPSPRSACRRGASPSPATPASTACWRAWPRAGPRPWVALVARRAAHVSSPSARGGGTRSGGWSPSGLEATCAPTGGSCSCRTSPRRRPSRACGGAPPRASFRSGR
ncbi:MAG: hypothetical protein H6694_00490 [Candidatus Latescibacteria bacterium]|nr:hypothetical protein [Candidatus Latescibacterota bacterium]